MESKGLCAVLVTILVLFVIVVPVSAVPVNGASTISIYRLCGQDQYQTSVAIAEAYNNEGEFNNVILASGDSFPDALSASILSKKLNAPILLVGNTVNASSDAFNYISTHSSQQKGTVYIVGGISVIGSDFETKLASMGYSNIKRLGGTDRYNTNMLIVNEVNIPQDTPVFIASGENFPDALSIASFSGSNQYPTLLVGADYLPEKTKNYLLGEKPSSVYITGGISVVSQDLESQINALVPGATVTRLAGDDRFGTNSAVLNKFSLAPDTIYIANGNDFQDVLSGSAVAAKTGNPIILVDDRLSTLPPAVEAYLKKLSGAEIQPKVIALGDTDVVSDNLMQQVNNVLSSATEEKLKNNVNSGFKLPDNIISMTIGDDSPCCSIWTPNNQEAVLSKVSDWLNKATLYTDKIPQSDESFVSADNYGPSILYLTALDKRQVTICPAYYIAKTGETTTATEVLNENGVVTTITTENPMYKAQYVQDVLVLDNGGDKTYIKSEPLYNWLKNDEWMTEFKRW